MKTMFGRSAARLTAGKNANAIATRRFIGSRSLAAAAGRSFTRRSLAAGPWRTGRHNIVQIREVRASFAIGRRGNHMTEDHRVVELDIVGPNEFSPLEIVLVKRLF